MIEILRPRAALLAVLRTDDGVQIIAPTPLSEVGADDGLMDPAFEALFEPVPIGDVSAEELAQLFGAHGNGTAPSAAPAPHPVKKRAPRVSAARPPRKKNRDVGAPRAAKQSPGRAPKWDVALANKLWGDPSLTNAQIAQRAGTKEGTLSGYAHNHDWGRRPRPTSGHKRDAGSRGSRFCTGCSNTVSGDPCPVCGAPA